MDMIGVDINGGDALIKGLANAEQEIAEQANELIQGAGIDIEADAKQACPVDTGRLRASIKYTPGNMECTVYTNVEYAKFQEFGTVYQKAQPFLFPAFEKNTKRLQGELKDLLS